jgi:hypothetical protein
LVPFIAWVIHKNHINQPSCMCHPGPKAKDLAVKDSMARAITFGADPQMVIFSAPTRDDMRGTTSG